MLKELLQERDLLPILQMDDGSQVTKDNWESRRKELRAALEKYSYGHTPEVPDQVWGVVIEEDNDAFAGKCCLQKIRVVFNMERGVFDFPFQLIVPKNVKRPPVFLNIGFLRELPNKYVPAEEITDAGYALAMVCYEDIVNDAHYGDYSDGLAAFFGVDICRGPEEWGKIGMWAYGASRILDYLFTREDVDAVICTHDHLDHLDPDTVGQIHDAQRFLTTVEGNAHMEKLGKANVQALRTGESVTVGDCKLTAVFACHTVEAFGLIVEAEGKVLYFSGDTLYDEQLLRVREYHPDIVFLCINGRLGNMNVNEALRVAKGIGAKINIPNHYDMFASNSEDPHLFADFISGGMILEFNRPYKF